MVAFAVKTLSEAKSDFGSLICSDSKSLNKANLLFVNGMHFD